MPVCAWYDKLALFIDEMNKPLLLLIMMIGHLKSFIKLPIGRNLVKSSVIKRYLNRILFEEKEVSVNEDNTLAVSLLQGDNRLKHINKILKLEEGDKLKCGILNAGMTDHAIISFQNTSYTPLDRICTVNLGRRNDLIQNINLPNITFLLAVPRPERLARLLPVISSIGVKALYLIDGQKVEKAYFGSHLLRQPEQLQSLLIEGLMQASCAYHLPTVTITRSGLRSLLTSLTIRLTKTEDKDKDQDKKEEDNKKDSVLRLIAHPPDDDEDDLVTAHSYLTYNQLVEAHYTAASATLADNKAADHQTADHRQVGAGHADDPAIMPRLADYEAIELAIGPEGGWTPQELTIFEQQGGYHRYSLGRHVLRTDVAVPILLQQMHDLASLMPTKMTKMTKR